jgi:site-specific DNA recombinase
MPDSFRHKGQIHDGLHAAIIDQDIWDRVQVRLADQTQMRLAPYRDAQSFLAGKLYDDRGNRMGPSHAAKGGRRWRYYVSRAVLKGRHQDAGAVTRVSAAEIEKQVFGAVKAVLASSARSVDWPNTRSDGGPRVRAIGSLVATGKPCPEPSNYADIRNAIERVTIGTKEIEIRLCDNVCAEGQDRTLTIAWRPPSPYQRREIIQGEGDPSSRIRPMRVRARAVFLEALGNAHRWLDELMTDPHQSIELLAAREGKTERSVRMTLTLAFVAPPIVAAAIEGRLPRGFGVKRMMDLPMTWSEQWTALGLKAPART